MGKLEIQETPIEGLYVVRPELFPDERGYFTETYNRRDFMDAGLTMEFVQDNCSRSSVGVLRGLHYQKKHPQGKLVRACLGSVFDAVVDIRPGSATFGQWFGTELSEENGRQLYIPAGFAHGFCVLSPQAVFCYKTTDYYRPGDEGGIRWDDVSIGIYWPTKGPAPVLSEKDRLWPMFRDIFPEGRA